jgi:serine/threonine protein kinase/tetratricopeptide (TPR) repeat protein
MSHSGETPTGQLSCLWLCGQAPDVQEFLAALGPLDPAQVVALLRVDQRERWQRGERVAAEDYLQRFPALETDPESALEIVYGEWLLREELTETPALEEYQRRFPRHADRLRQQIDLRRALEDGDALAFADTRPGRPAAEYPGKSSGNEAAWPTVPGYEILGELGRGGMGIVYQARQRSLKRIVALKMILMGPHAGPEELARFRAEAEAVARFQHPNIVQIYEVGEHDGLPFFSLEFVAGGSLHDYLQGKPQPPRQAAELVATLAGTIHYAHQRGVVHRDLKPANILLQEERSPRRKDAKEDQEEKDEEQLPGPSLRSSFAPLRLCERFSCIPKITDFGLAKLLELPGLTQSEGAILGTPSYMPPEQAQGQSGDVGPAADVYSLGAILYEMLTGRPPFRGATLLDTLAQVMADDPVAPRYLQPKVPNDLETICLKCLHKEPGRRYATALALAEDCAAFLRGEPIKARPTPLWEQALKWARRRPAAAALAGTSALAVLVVVVLVLTANARLREQRRLAEKSHEAQTNLLEAQAQRRLAVAHLRKARDAIDLMLTRVGYDSFAPLPYMEATRRALLEDALRFYQDLAREEEADAELRHEWGRVHRRLGKVCEMLGDLEKGEQSFRAALAVHEQLAAEFPGVPAYRQELAASYNNLGLLLNGRNQPEKAEQALRQALELQEKLVANQPNDPGNRLTLGESYDALGIVLDRLQRFREAEQALRHAGEWLGALVADYPNVRDYQYSRANNNLNLAVFLARRGRRPEAEPAFRDDLEFWTMLADESPTTPRFRTRQALSCYNLSNLLIEEGQFLEAEKLLRRALDLRKKLTDDFPSVPGHHTSLGDTLRKLALLLRDRGDIAAAAPLWEQAIDQYRAAVKVNPDAVELRRSLFLSCWNLADARLRLGEHPSAARLAGELPSFFLDSWEDCYHATRLLARCAGLAAKDAGLAEEQRRPLAHEYAKQAVQMLREAIRRGYKDVRFIQDDRILDVLRDREDFQQLLAELEKKR